MPALVKAPKLTPSCQDVAGLEGRQVRVDGPLEVRADILPDSIREEADGSLTMRLRIATGYPVARLGFFDGRLEEFEEVLSFEEGAHRDERLSSGRTPLLAAHQDRSLDSVLGVVFDPVWNRTAETVDATCRISGRDSLAGLRKDVRSRIIANTSAGYRVHQYRDVTEKGAKRRRLLAIDWEIREASLVPIGADPTSSTRAEGQGQAARGETSTLWTRAPTHTMDPEIDPTTAPAASTTATQEPAAAATRAAPPAAPAATPAVAPMPATRDEGQLELERSRSIRQKLTRAAIPLDSPLALELLDSRVPAAQATERILDHVTCRDASSAPIHGQVVVGDTGEDKALRAIQDVLESRCLRAQLTPAESTALDARLQGNPFQYRRLLSLGQAFLESVHGVRGLEGLRPLELATEVLSRRSGMSATRAAPGFHVTSDFASVLANVANKGLQKAFLLTPETYSQWTLRGTLPDFKSSRRVALGDAPRLVRKPEGGEVSFGAVSDKGETISLLTYARALAISREAMINDDLSAFSRFPRAFGSAAQQLIADLVYSILTTNAALADGFALFDATNHLNLITAGSNAFTAANAVAALSNTRILGRQQKGIAPGNGETAFTLSVDLPHLRVPEQLETVAQQVTGSIQPALVSSVNPFQGSFRSVMAEPRLGAVSAAAFYMMADPSAMDTIEVSFLEGEQGPVIESRLNWEADGVEMKCRLDVGAAATEYRGLYKNNGAT